MDFLIGWSLSVLLQRDDLISFGLCIFFISRGGAGGISWVVGPDLRAYLYSHPKVNYLFLLVPQDNSPPQHPKRGL